MNGYNFTDRVRKVLQMAREEAARLHHEYVGTEHILLGLIREGEGVAAAVLTNLNVDLEEIQQKIEETVKKGKAAAAAGPACLALIAPGQIRSQATAIYYFIISVAGQLIGPPPVGWMTDLFADPAKLRYAMTIEALAVGIPALLLVRAGLMSYRRRVEELETLIGTPAQEAAHA